jgi:hypothetical protein
MFNMEICFAKPHRMENRKPLSKNISLSWLSSACSLRYHGATIAVAKAMMPMPSASDIRNMFLWAMSPCRTPQM